MSSPWTSVSFIGPIRFRKPARKTPALRLMPRRVIVSLFSAGSIVLSSMSRHSIIIA